MEAFITQCPNCGTAFEVTERELAIAEGIVRCGQCRHVFTASDFSVGETSVSATITDDDTPDFARQDDAESDMDLRATFRDAPPPPDIELDDDVLFSDELGVEEAEAQVLESRKIKLSDDFLTSTQEDGHAFSREIGQQGFNDPLPLMAEPAAVQPHSDADWDDQRPFILDDEPEPADPEYLRDADTADSDGGSESDEDTLTDLPVSPETTESNPAEADHFSAVDDDTALAADAPLRASLNNKLNRLDEPLEMRLGHRPRLPRGDWAWLTLALIGLVALLAQYVIYRFDSLAADPRFQPSLSQVCRLAGCTLPVADTRRLRAGNLVVRSHPQLQNALLAEFLLSNDAGFDQAFPALLLQFSDGVGQTVASRHLKPEDYLRGEMAGARSLPARQSVLISLELLDPGPTATGYRLELLDPR